MRLYGRISSVATTSRWSDEIDCAVLAGLSGVRASLGISTAGSTGLMLSPASLNRDALDSFLAKVVTTKTVLGKPLGLILGLMGEGPPDNAAWRAINGGAVPLTNRRPPEAYFPYMTSILQSVIDITIDAFLRAGINPKEYLCFQLDNEPGVGGSGGPSPSTAPAPYDSIDEGTWDGPGDLPSPHDTTYATWQEKASYIFPRLNFYGGNVMSPCLECQDSTLFATELASFGTRRGAWFRVPTIWTANCYISMENSAYDGLERSIGGVVEAWESKSLSCRRQLLNAIGPALLVNNPTSSHPPFAWTEFGVSVAMADMGSGRTLVTNHRLRGKMMLAMCHSAAAQSTAGVCSMYAVRDSTGAVDDNDYYGLQDIDGVYYTSFHPFGKNLGGIANLSDPPSGSWSIGATEPVPPA